MHRLEVGGQHLRRLPFDRDVDQLFFDGGPRGAIGAGEIAHPAGVVPPRRRTVGAQVTPGQLRVRDVKLELVPFVEPALRADESDGLAAVRSEAKPAPARRGLEEAAPSGLQDLAHVRGLATTDHCDELLSSDGRAIERASDSLEQVVHLRLGELQVLEPRLDVAQRVRAKHAGVDGKVGGASEVQRSPHEPRLDQGLPLPECLTNVRRRAVDTHGYLQFGE